MLFFHYTAQDEWRKALYAIDYHGEIDMDLIGKICKIIGGERYESNSVDDAYMKYKNGELTLEEYKSTKEQSKKFDDNDDFDLIYSLFIEKFNIDLIKDDINWFIYKFHRENLLTTENALTERIKARSFRPHKIPKKGDSSEINEYNKAGRERMKRYALCAIPESEGDIYGN